MTYVKTVRRGNSNYGPYVYKSVRVGGKVVSKYLGKYHSAWKESDPLEDRPKTRWHNKDGSYDEYEKWPKKEPKYVVGPDGKHPGIKMSAKSLNFKDEKAYKKFLAYGHIHKAFKKHNTKIKIAGKPHKVNHAKS